ncbi:MAG: hypothetical protein JWP16_1189 [Alphaproteobacteria bacterium]|jgi:hypothetical protein|nr:hypothetical protein [Alphaproteobacteria bacterium]MDB5740149.1 hypothetical protein [Alphaproteobacteria bacterium]
MITRAASLLGLVWMCLPHHPDLGLPAPADACAGPACILFTGDIEREAILRRLREIRSELHGSNIRSATEISPKAWPSARR